MDLIRPDAMHNARRLIRAYDFCSSIRHLLADTVTYKINSKMIIELHVNEHDRVEWYSVSCFVMNPLFFFSWHTLALLAVTYGVWLCSVSVY